MAEIGLYGSWGPWGAAFGVDTENGPTASMLQSVVVGPSADAWASYSFGEGFEGVAVYAGVGVPFGTPTPVSVNLQRNMETGNPFGTFGFNLTGFSDFIQVGIYIEGGVVAPFPTLSPVEINDIIEQTIPDAEQQAKRIVEIEMPGIRPSQRAIDNEFPTQFDSLLETRLNNRNLINTNPDGWGSPVGGETGDPNVREGGGLSSFSSGQGLTGGPDPDAYDPRGTGVNWGYNAPDLTPTVSAPFGIPNTVDPGLAAAVAALASQNENDGPD